MANHAEGDAAHLTHYDKTRTKPDVTIVYEDDLVAHQLVTGPNTQGTIEAYRKQPETRNHTFYTLDGFLEYLNSDHCKAEKVEASDAPEDFVYPPRYNAPRKVILAGAKHVVALLNYGAVPEHQATLDLKHAQEYSALTQLFAGVSQKELWRAMVTDLAGCVDDALLLQISAMRISGKSGGEIQIDDLGIRSGGASATMEVTFRNPKDGGDLHAKISTEWEYSGPVLECFDRSYTIPLRLELVPTEGGSMAFVFHPRGLARILRGVQLDLATEIKSRLTLPEYTVHEGTV